MASDSLKGAASAAQAAAETAGKAVDAAREAGTFIAKYVAGPLEQGVGIFEDRLRYMRWERQLRLMRRAEEFLEEMGLAAPTRAVPLKIAIPLLQAASMEEDNSLQDKWAALLVNAATDSGAGVQRAHIEILAQISPLEAKILDVVYSLPFEQIQHDGATTHELPNSSEHVREPREPRPLPPPDVQLALANLERVGCLNVAKTMGGGEHFGSVNPTVLGRSFVAACRVGKRGT